MAVSSGRFPCRPLTCWSSRLLRKLASGVVGGGELGMGGVELERSYFVLLCYSRLAQCLMYPVGQGNCFLTFKYLF